ncbi:YbaB/EbfC family nucleoid-associated protein [Nocardia sp. NPDC049149]|uniref:YbaB/EbfC family nucleoid-associated protein n=1 Tax=Nocardia sp. NPDC049149 TaxID=3364315 RepID=UPI0037197E48
MTNDWAKAEMSAMLGEFEQQLDLVGRIRRERARIRGRASVRGRRVTVVVDVDGALLDTTFGADIVDLDYREIAKAVTEAAKLAAVDAARQARELMAPLLVQRARMPRLHEFVDGMPDLTDRLGERDPGSIDTAENGEFGAGGEPFAEVMGRRGAGVTDSGW